MKKLVSLFLALGMTFSFVACSSPEVFIEDDLTNENNITDETEQLPDASFNEKETTISAIVGEGVFTIIEESDTTIYRFNHPKLREWLDEKQGAVTIYYMQEGSKKGNYTNGNFYSDEVEITATYFAEDGFGAMYKNGIDDWWWETQYTYENNTISWIFTFPDYKPIDYEFIAIEISTNNSAFEYIGHFTDDVFNDGYARYLDSDFTLTAQGEIIEINFDEDGIHFNFIDSTYFGNGYAIIPNGTQIANGDIALFYKDRENMEISENLIIEISENNSLFSFSFEDGSYRYGNYRILD